MERKKRTTERLNGNKETDRQTDRQTDRLRQTKYVYRLQKLREKKQERKNK